MKPFDLEAAKRGEPIVTRDGCKAKFIAHVPEAESLFKLAVLIDGEIFIFAEAGNYWSDKKDSTLDLFMAPKKRTVWVNLLISGKAFHYDTEESANRMIGSSDQRIGGKAYPVEIEE